MDPQPIREQVTCAPEPEPRQAGCSHRGGSSPQFWTLSASLGGRGGGMATAHRVGGGTRNAAGESERKRGQQVGELGQIGETWGGSVRTEVQQRTPAPSHSGGLPEASLPQRAKAKPRPPSLPPARLSTARPSCHQHSAPWVPRATLNVIRSFQESPLCCFRSCFSTPSHEGPCSRALHKQGLPTRGSRQGRLGQVWTMSNRLRLWVGFLRWPSHLQVGGPCARAL